MKKNNHKESIQLVTLLLLIAALVSSDLWAQSSEFDVTTEFMPRYGKLLQRQQALFGPGSNCPEGPTAVFGLTNGGFPSELGAISTPFRTSFVDPAQDGNTCVDSTWSFLDLSYRRKSDNQLVQLCLEAQEHVESLENGECVVRQRTVRACCHW